MKRFALPHLLSLLTLGASACAMRGESSAPMGAGMAAPAMSAEAGADAGGDGSEASAAGPRDAEALTAVDAAAEDSPLAMEPDTRYPRAGLLTAGTFDDTLNPDVLRAFATTMANNASTGAIAPAFTGEVSVLRVVDEAGRPVADVDVTIGDRRGRKTLRSGTDGRVVVLSGWDLNGDTSGSFFAVADGAQVEVTLGTQDAVLVVPGLEARAPRALDLALVVDATGSMGDELEYLKVELTSIASDIARAYPNVDQRYALVVYRDRGDAYVSRRFRFVRSLDRFNNTLGHQRANGGGDYPEAMHTAMADAANLRWRARDTARVLFLVADAPPHDNKMARTLHESEELRAQGVAIYPVAASGVASKAELVMRASAAMSGGEYIFLTDDSGVGNSHEEPHIPCYAVQSLRDAMLRAIHSELSGQRVEADPRRTIRQVGKGRAGVCQHGQPQLAAG